MTVEHTALEAWLESAQLGTVVETPAAAGTGPLGLTARAVIDAQLPPGLARPWVVYASQLAIVGGGDFGALATGSSPSYLEFAYGFGNVRVRAAVDLHVTGGIWQLPPCAAVEVIAQLQPLGGVPPPLGRFTITAAPGTLGYQTFPTLTSPQKTAAGALGSPLTFGRPACAIGYRILTPGDTGATNVPCSQTGGATVLSTDSAALRFYGTSTISRDGWMPLHPQTTQLQLQNFFGAPTAFAAQWCLSIG